jgi:flagellin
MVIQHCVEAMNADRQLNIAVKEVGKSSEKLSTGYKINISADDAAGLGISEKMRKQIRGLTQATSNAEDGISMVQVADGAMAEIQDMMDRGVELSVKAANGTLSDTDRSYIQMEIDHIKDEVDAIKERTKFNEIYVLKGDMYEYHEDSPHKIVREGALPAWVKDGGAAATGYLSETYTDTKTYISTTTVSPTQTVAIDHPAASLDFSGFTTEAAKKSLIGQGFNTTCCSCDNYYSIEFTSGNTSTMESISSQAYVYKIGIGDINMNSTSPTPAEQLLQRIIAGTDNGNPRNHYTMLTADYSKNVLWIYDDRANRQSANSNYNPSDLKSWVDWTYHYAVNPNGSFGEGVMKEYDAYKIDEKYEIRQKIDLQVGADTNNTLTCVLPNISVISLGLVDADVTRQPNGAEDSISIFGNAKKLVSYERSKMGSYQNRLEHTVNNLGNILENTTFSESQVRDTDMASEMVKFSNANILTQSGQSMLAQANQSNQGVLSLLE